MKNMELFLAARNVGGGVAETKNPGDFYAPETIHRNKFSLSLRCAPRADFSPPLANRHSVRAVAVPWTQRRGYRVQT